MRIGIITIHNSTNYGASLQAWALYKFLVDCMMITSSAKDLLTIMACARKHSAFI